MSIESKFKLLVRVAFIMLIVSIFGFILSIILHTGPWWHVFGITINSWSLYNGKKTLYIIKVNKEIKNVCVFKA